MCGSQQTYYVRTASSSRYPTKRWHVLGDIRYARTIEERELQAEIMPTHKMSYRKDCRRRLMNGKDGSELCHWFAHIQHTLSTQDQSTKENTMFSQGHERPKTVISMLA